MGNHKAYMTSCSGRSLEIATTSQSSLSSSVSAVRRYPTTEIVCPSNKKIHEAITRQPLYTTLGPHDVLLGRGTGPNEHAGNIRYRAIVQNHLRHAMDKTRVSSSNSTQLHSLVVFKSVANAVVKAVHTNGGRFLVQCRSVSPHDDTASLTTSITTGASTCHNNTKNYVFQEVSKAVAVSKALQAIRHQSKKVVKPEGVRRGDDVHHQHGDTQRHDYSESTSFLPSVHHRATTTSPNGTTNINNNEISIVSSPLLTTETLQLPTSSGGFVPILPCLKVVHGTNTAGTATSRRDHHGQQLNMVIDKIQQPQECATSGIVSPPWVSHPVPTSLQENLQRLYQSSTTLASAPSFMTQKNDPLSIMALAASSLLVSTGRLHQQQSFPPPALFQQDFYSSSPFLILDRLCDEIRILKTMMLQSSSSSIRGPKAMRTNPSTSTTTTQQH